MDKSKEQSAKKTFWVSLVICLAFLVAGIAAPGKFGEYTNKVFSFMTNNLGWSFILGASAFIIVIIFVMVSPYGKIKLGKDDDKPEYSNFVWFAMLFSCGMGIGLLFWGVSEPINHYMWPPFGEAGTAGAAHLAMRASFFHWGLHPWAIYAVVGAALAYFAYRKGLPMMLSSTLEPVLGQEGIYRGWGIVVNVIAVFATLFGMATSLGLGAMQVGSGLESLFGIPSTTWLWVTLTVVFTAGAVASTMSGIDKGIKNLSTLNVYIATLLMVLIFVIGPTVFILNLLGHATGDYLQNIISMSFRLDPMIEGTEGWITGWTVFYWAWWIAWAPFVGTFIARISKGRTLRQFITGVLFIPTGVSMVWFSIFGGSALYIEHFGSGGIAEAVSVDSAAGFFAMLQNFPLPQLLIPVAMLSVAIFFVTSSDSASYVNAMLTSNGNPNPPPYLRFTWGVLEGAIAALLLITGAGSGLSSLQTASVVGGFPFMLVMLLMIYCLFKSFKRDAEALSLEKSVLIGKEESVKA